MNDRRNATPFYVLDTRRGRRDVLGDTEFGEEVPWNRADPPLCETCGRHVGPLEWLPPFRVELACWDKQFGDLVFRGGGNFLVSERFKGLYTGSDLIGLQGFEPVEVVRVKRHRQFRGKPPRYYRAAVTRSEAAIDEVRSGYEGFVEEAGKALWVCLACRRPSLVYPKRWKSLVVQPGTWSGEDVFIPRGCSEFLTTERFKRFCEDNEFTNVVFVPAEAYWDDFYPSENLERAKEILNQPPGDHILEKTNARGEILRFDTESGYFVRATRDGRPLEIDRPFSGIDFWRRQR